MIAILSFVFLVLGPAAAIFIGCLGLEMIHEDHFGWVLLAIGVGYPAGAIIYDRRRREHLIRPK